MNVNDPKSIITWRIWYLNLRPMGLWFLFWKVDLVHGNRIFLIPSSRIETCSFTSRDASTSLTSLAIDADEGNHHLHILQTLHGPLINDRIFRGSTWGFAMEPDGTWWNYILEVGTWDYPQEFDGKTWENMENNKPFKAFQALRRNDFFSDFPSFQIPSMTIQQNLALSEIKVGTIFTTERGYEN